MQRSFVLASVLAIAAGCGSPKASSEADGGAVAPDAPPPGGAAGGCDGASLLPVPSDLAAPGPWPVGARTVSIAGLTVEVWYPAVVGSDAGLPTERYDIRTEIPASEAAKIPDADNPWAPCDCVRGLPFDDTHGPYPVVLFVHGTAGFRFQSLHFVTHWASRGFVVLAADHPGLKLGDLLASACGGTAPPQDLSGNLDALIAAVANPTGDLAFLAGHVDATRLAVTGHSAGANAAAAASTKPGVQVVISLAGNQADASSPILASSLYMGGLADSIVSWSQVMTAYGNAAKPRALVGITGGGHLTFSDLCQLSNAAGQNLLQVAEADQVCGAQLAGFLFDCDPSHIDGPTGWKIVDDATSAVLESTLQCRGPSTLDDIGMRYPQVSGFQHDP